MATELRALTPTNVKHTHTRTIYNLPNDSKQESKDTSYLYSVKQTMNNFLSQFDFGSFEIKYAKDKEAETEYLILNGKDDYMLQSLELHIFSCYCDGDHPEGEPPF